MNNLNTLFEDIEDIDSSTLDKIGIIGLSILFPGAFVLLMFLG